MALTDNCCVICEEYDENIVLFTQQSLEKCRTISAVRVAHKLKYHRLELPIAVDGFCGYHPRCWKNFTAVAKKYYDQSPLILLTSQSGNSSEEIPNDGIKNSSSSLKEPSQAMLNGSTTQETPKVCIYCGNDRKTSESKSQELCIGKEDLLHAIKKYAAKINDLEMLKKIDEYATSNEVAYHVVCKSAYQYESYAQIRKETTWHSDRENHKQAFEKFGDYIENEVVRGGRKFFLSSLCTVYNEIFNELFGENVENDGDLSFSEQYVEQKIRSIRDQVKIITMNHRKIVVSAKGIDNRIDEATFASLEKEDVLQRAALILRGDLLSIKIDELPENLTSKDLVDSEGSTLQSLQTFYTTLIGGLDYGRRNNPGHQREVNSLCQVVIDAVCNGKIKTPEQTRKRRKTLELV